MQRVVRLFNLHPSDSQLIASHRYHFNCIALSEQDAEDIGQSNLSFFSPFSFLNPWQMYTYVPPVKHRQVCAPSVSTYSPFFIFVRGSLHKNVILSCLHLRSTCSIESLNVRVAFLYDTVASITL